MKNKNNPVKAIPKTLIEKVIAAIDNHIDTSGAILDDYLASDGMVDELAIADQNLKNAIEALDEDENDFDTILRKLKGHSDLDENINSVLDILEDDDIRQYLKHEDGEEYFMVKINNMRDRDKLEEFIKQEIYPHYNDQQAYMVM